MKKKILSLGLILIIVSVIAGCSTAGSLHRTGIKYFTKGSYEESAKKLLEATHANPRRADYYVDYGLALTAIGNYEEALTQFDQAYHDKNVPVVLENNKRALRGKGIAYYSMGQYEKALEQFEQALQINELSELDVDILYYKGSALNANGSYKEAESAYTSILDINNKDDRALYERALCFHRLGEYEKSLEDYDKAISLQPKNYDYYFGKYNLLMATGDKESAAEVLEAAGQFEVKTDEDKFNQAKLFYYEGNYEAALAGLEEAYNSGFTDACFYTGEIFREQKDYEKAKYYYELYIAKGNLTSPFVYNQIASCLIKLGEYQEAIKYLEKGIQYNYSDLLQFMMKNEIIAYENLGMFDIALEKIKTYINSYPEEKEAIREMEFIKTRLIRLDNSDEESKE